jgi:hypothetical protein
LHYFLCRLPYLILKLFETIKDKEYNNPAKKQGHL